MEPHLTSSQVERVLRRASELAAPEPALDGAAGVSARALLAAADEAGIPLEAVRRSIAIERLGTPHEPQTGDRLLGPKLVTVDVELAMPVAEVMARLDAWLEQGHHLRRERWSAYEAEWRRRDGVVASGKRSVRSALGEGGLGEVTSLRAVARESPTGSVLRLTIDRSTDRAVLAGGGVTLAAAGVGAGVVTTIVAAPVFVLLAPAGIAVGAGVARIGRAQSDGMERELERVVEAVRGRVKPTTLRSGLRRWAHGAWHGRRS